MNPECNQIHRDSDNDSQLVIGLDTGRKRCGLARADGSLTLASPAGVVETAPRGSLGERISAQLDQSRVGLIVAGLPLDQHGNEGPACEFARELAGEVAAGLGCSLEFVDERFTTAFAERGRREAGREGRRVADVDAWAAAAILQAWLDRRIQDPPVE
jgi:putative Holliday junction resolvase